MPKIIELEQRSEAWHEFRKDKIGASLAGTIMGVNEYETPLQLYERLISGEEKEITPAMQRGIEFEPEARDYFNRSRSVNFQPVVMQSDVYPWMIASLDGWDGKDILEIKIQGRPIQSISIPPAHYSQGIHPAHFAQMQHQFAVSGANSGWHVAYYPDIDAPQCASKFIFRDEAYIKKLIEEELKFLECLKTLTPPNITEEDIYFDNDSVHEYQASLIASMQADIKERQDKLDELKAAFIKGLKHPITQCGNVRIRRIVRQGAINYSNIPELGEVNLESYRKPSIETWRFTAEQCGNGRIRRIVRLGDINYSDIPELRPDAFN
jgi:putative phage-type endonuclease